MTLSPAAPRRREAAVAAGTLLAGAALLPAARGAAPVLLLLAHLVAVAVVAGALRRGGDDGVWRWWAAAVAVLGLAPLAALVTGSSSAVPPAVAALAAAPLAYQGLVRWNRFRTYVSDPGDWLNGVSAVLAITAAGVLLQRRSGFLPAPWPDWREQLWLLDVGALVLLLGTAATVAAIGGLARDRRAWAVQCSLAALLVVSVCLRGGASDGVRLQAAWTLAALVVAACSVRPVRSAAVPASSQAPAVGSFVVLALAVGVLAATAVPRDGWGPTAYALAATLGVSVRVVHLLRELAQLAVSRREALTDELTGLANRRALLQHLVAATRQRRTTGLLLIDIDRFKEVNDRQGHHAGDALLRRVVAAAARALPADAVFARLGGDEFAVLLPGCDDEGATAVGREVHEAVVRHVDIGLSIGVRSLPAGAVDPDRLLRQADTAMYAAKTAGGGVGVYDSDVDARSRDRAALAADLKALVGAGEQRLRRELVVHYQPQVDVLTGRVVGVEALVRWEHPVRGLLPPVTFLELAEEQGLMDELTVHLLHRATADAALWAHGGLPLRVSVNLSASTLAHPDLLRIVDDVLARSGLAPGRLVLEVTETTLMADPDLALEVTRGLTRRGVQLSIDDYGTGYSSLAYLTDLPATELKLDRAFTVRVLHEPRTAQIVEATVALAHRLGLRVVAEGVEDAATRDVLGRLDVDESQGYLHARPMPPGQVQRWLELATGGLPGGPAGGPVGGPAGGGVAQEAREV
ncbi:putative bifunctional diguanylate cyclase/phosphodiesterase [Kineococcus sp. SYSU DK006]|uniref:putative bifunctional diguanylate cyclase/phosphodiesterase n=1 Tax=Kineococcus sp. SYSU DK006 TaxID=3383127 RepID=UPI003D7D7FE6